MIKFHRQFDTRTIKLLIFDLDGTLIDSRLDLIHSVNAMLRHFKRSELPGEVIASYVGDGAPMLVRRALGDPKDEHFAKSALEFFLTYYRAHKLDNTHVYAGIKDSLAAIRNSNGIRRTHALQQHFIGSDAQRETKGAVAIICVKPVISGLHGEGCGHTNSLMARARDLEIDFLLAFEQDFPVIQPPRRVHRAISSDQIFSRRRDVYRSLQAGGRRHPS